MFNRQMFRDGVRHDKITSVCAKQTYPQHLSRGLLVLIPLFALAACSKPKATGEYTFEPISEKVRAKLPHADQLTLSLKEDGTMILSASKLPVIQGTWVQAGDKVTFSKGGVIATEYKVKPEGLIPFESNKEGVDYRFKRN